MNGLSESIISKNADDKALHKAFYDLRKKCVNFQNKYKTTLISFDDFEELRAKLVSNSTTKSEYQNSYTKWRKEDDLRLLDWEE
jgi:hypothetical protein|tara:strand:- start:41 stop:292 length:252 start_codon:yes stop_codon:yes gene_type:complete